MAETWINHLMAGNPVWNIGQLDKATVRALDVLVRRGVATKGRVAWCFGPMKTVWNLV